MSDIFLGELLALILLIPVILRPFSKKIQSIQSISILAPLSLLCIALLIWGQGFSVSLIFTAIPSVLVFLVNIPALIRFFSGLPTDWYGNGIKIFGIFQLLLIICAVTAVFIFRSEQEPVYTDIAEYRLPITGSFRTDFTRKESMGEVSAGVVYVWAPLNQTEKKTVIFYLPDAGISARDCRITAKLLVSKGYTVVAGDFYQSRYIQSVFNNSVMRPFAVRFSRIFPFFFSAVSDDDIIREKTRELAALISFWNNTDDINKEREDSSMPSSRDFKEAMVFSEGRACNAAEIYRLLEPEIITGAFYLYTANSPQDIQKRMPDSFIEKDTLQIHFGHTGIPANAGEKKAAIVYAPDKELFGYGNIGILYPGDAFFLGGSRDSKCSKAMLIAGLADGYYSRRQNFMCAGIGDKDKEEELL